MSNSDSSNEEEWTVTADASVSYYSKEYGYDSDPDVEDEGNGDKEVEVSVNINYQPTYVRDKLRVSESTRESLRQEARNLSRTMWATRSYTPEVSPPHNVLVHNIQDEYLRVRLSNFRVQKVEEGYSECGSDTDYY